MFPSSHFFKDNREFLQKLWTLAIPVSLQAMMFSMLGLIDIVMVGHLGELAVAAIGFGNRIYFFNLVLTAAFGSGMSVFASQYVGAGDPDGVRRTLCQALIASLLFNTPFVLSYLLFPELVLSVISTEPSLLNLAVTYMTITGSSILCVAIVVPLEAALRSTGDTKTPTCAGFYAIIVNVILNYLLIFGAFGFPKLGVAGSALGTAISRLVQMLILLFHIRRKHRSILPRKDDIARAGRKHEMFRYLKVAIPIVSQDGLWAFGLIIYNIIYALIGVNELAVMSAVSSIEAILMSFFIGFGVGASIMLGHDLGAQQFDKAWYQGVMIMRIAPLMALLVGALLILFRSPILSFFGQFDKDTLDLAELTMTIAGLALVMRVANFTGIIGLLRSGGDVRYCAVLSFVGMWFFGIPLTFCGGVLWRLPLHWVFVCALSEELVKMVLVIYRIYSKRWLRNIVSGPANSPEWQ